MEYYINEPYPSIDNLDMNIAYGQILLSNIGGLQCEMNAVSLYFYNHVILEQLWPELSQAMHKISIVEMHHLEIFAKMCCHLGVDPRLWDCQNDFLEYWSPGYNVYPRQINTMLENAIIQDVLNRIIKDEQLHVQILESFLYEYNHNLQTDI